MPEITKEEYIRRALKFVEAHKASYTERELDYIKKNCEWGMDRPFVSDLLRQVYDEAGMTDINQNMYEGFLKLLEENFDINRDIIEIGGGINPSLAKKIALRQKSGTITVYDPRLISNIYSDIPNLKLKKQAVSSNTNIEQADLYIAFMPCEATQTIIDIAGKNQTDFIIAACEGGPHGDIYDYFEDEEEWLHSMMYHARRQIENNGLGTFERKSLQKYNDPYPVFFNRRSR